MTNSAVIVRADPSEVCMINDQNMGRPQIPVVVEHRTYYGCCPMCKQRLEADPNARVAQDPISNRVVDKSTAIIGTLPNGRVLYFERAENLDEYARRNS
jgi:YHS domain-containing protein